MVWYMVHATYFCLRTDFEANNTPFFRSSSALAVRNDDNSARNTRMVSLAICNCKSSVPEPVDDPFTVDSELEIADDDSLAGNADAVPPLATT